MTPRAPAGARGGARTAALAAALALLGPAAHAGEKGDAYAAMVARWVDDPMGARNELITWSDWDLRAGVIENRVNRDLNRAAAAMLHTELALEAQRLAPVTSQRHMELAEEHVRELRRGGAEFRTRWTRLRALARLEAYDLNGAREILEDAVSQRPVAPELLLTLGVVWELEAKMTAADVAARPESPLAAGAEERRRLDARRVHQLDEAVALYHQALERDPDSDETLLRVARIQLLRGERDAAAPALDRLVESRELDLRYLALLLRAREREQNGKLEESLRDYRAARRLVPLSQAARVGEASVYLALGAPEQAAELLQVGLDERRAHPIDVDPWWLYPQGRVSQLRELILALRKQARSS